MAQQMDDYEVTGANMPANAPSAEKVNNSGVLSGGAMLSMAAQAHLEHLAQSAVPEVKNIAQDTNTKVTDNKGADLTNLESSVAGIAETLSEIAQNTSTPPTAPNAPAPSDDKEKDSTDNSKLLTKIHNAITHSNRFLSEIKRLTVQSVTKDPTAGTKLPSLSEGGGANQDSDSGDSHSVLSHIAESVDAIAEKLGGSPSETSDEEPDPKTKKANEDLSQGIGETFNDVVSNGLDKILAKHFGALLKKAVVAVAPIVLKVGLIAAGIVGVGFGIKMLWNWAKVKVPALITSAIDGIKAGFQKAVEWLGNTLKAAWQGIKDAVNWVGDKLKAGFDWVVDGVSKALEWVVGGITRAVDAIARPIRKFFRIKDQAVEAVSNVREGMRDKIESARQIATGAGQAVASTVSNARTAIQEQGIVGAVRSGASAAATQVSGAVSSARNAIQEQGVVGAARSGASNMGRAVASAVDNLRDTPRSRAGIPIHGQRGDPKGIVLHHTAGGSLQGNINYLRSGADGRRVGYHYLIDRDGSVHQIADDSDRVWHAGGGNRGTGLNNTNSVGISAVAKDDSDVTPEQSIAGANLTRTLMERYNIPITAVRGHGDVSSNKARDEGHTILRTVNSQTTSRGAIAADDGDYSTDSTSSTDMYHPFSGTTNDFTSISHRSNSYSAVSPTQSSRQGVNQPQAAPVIAPVTNSTSSTIIQYTSNSPWE